MRSLFCRPAGSRNEIDTGSACRVIIGYILGYYWDNGKENGNSYYRVIGLYGGFDPGWVLGLDQVRVGGCR